MDKRIETGLLAVAILLIIFLSLDKCNQQSKGDITQLIEQNYSLHRANGLLAKSNVQFLHEVELREDSIERYKTELLTINSQKSMLSIKIATLRRQLPIIQNDTVYQLIETYQVKDSISDINDLVCENAIDALTAQSNTLQQVIFNKDTIIGNKGLEIQNLNTILKKQRKISNRRIIGWTLGGFTVGVGVTALAILLKK